MTNTQAPRARQERFASAMEAREYDFCVVSAPAAVAYLTDVDPRGFSDHGTTVLVDRDANTVLVTSDADEAAVAASGYRGRVTHWSHGPAAFADREVVMRGLAVGLPYGQEARGAFDWRSRAVWEPFVSRAHPGWAIGEAEQVLADASRVKDDDELRRLRQAANLADIGYTAVVDRMTPDLRAHEIVRNVDRSLRAAGGGGYWSPLEEPAGVTGWSHYPHGSIATLFDRVPETGVLDVAQLLPFGIHPLSENYTGAIAATIALSEPGAALRSQASLLTDAVQAAIARIGPGVTTGEVHAAFASVLADHGTTPAENVIGYGLGTGLTAPLIAADTSDVLEPGMALTIRASSDVPGAPGIVYQTSLVVTGTGHELLNIVPLRLIHLY